MHFDIYDGNNIMRRGYESSFGNTAMSLRERYEHALAQPEGTQIWCWDGRNHNARRQSLYPQYKTNRPPTPEDVFAQIRLFRDILVHAPVTQFNVEGWEADDVVATLAKHYQKAGKYVTLHTNDMDYGQLLRLGNVTLNGVNMKDVPARWVCLYKAMQGDTSDNIDGIPGFGPGRWMEMKDYWHAIEKWIGEGDQANLLDLPFKPKVKAWLADPANIETLQAMLQIVHLMDVPEDELVAGMTVGKFQPMLGHEILQRYFL